MGLDSVELVMGFEEAFGIGIPDEVAAGLITPRMVVEYVMARVPTVPADGCATRSTFYALRRGMRAAGAAGRLRPDTPLDQLTDKAGWPMLWARVRAAAGEDDWPREMPWRGWLGDGPRTAGELVRWIVLHRPRPVASAGRAWTRERIELVVRHVVWETVGVADFRLDDQFVRDMGID